MAKVTRAVLGSAIATGIIWVGQLVCRLVWGGDCYRPDLQSNFDREEYLGRWYEMFRSKNVPFESENCVTATYRDDGDNYIQVENIQWEIGSSDPPGKPDRYGTA